MARAKKDRAVLSAILKTSLDGIIVINERGTIVHFNEAAEKIFGYDREEAIGWNVVLLMPESRREIYSVALARFFRTGEPRISGKGRRLLGQRSDGSEFPMELAVCSAYRNGSQRLFVGIVRPLESPIEKTVQAPLRLVQTTPQQLPW